MPETIPGGWEDVASLRVRVATETDARQLISWKFDGPELADGKAPTDVNAVLDRDNSYYSVISAQGELVAFCCFGQTARILNGDYSASGIDLRAGLRPDLIASGQTARFLAAMVVFAKALFRPIGLRTTLDSSNQVALRAYQAAGFRRQATFLSSDGRECVVLTLAQ